MHLFIDNADDLRKYCEFASQFDVVAVDTEFLREHTYYPVLCSVQLCAGNSPNASEQDTCAIVDMIAFKNNQDATLPLKNLLTNKSITKIFHAPAQDLEVLYNVFGEFPSPIFDTQLASAFIGHRFNIGYGDLVQELCGVHLPKTESMTDWSRRPLDVAQIEYAEDDVRYLESLYNKLKEELIEKDRLSWVMPEMQALTEHALDLHKSETAYLHVKGTGGLSRKELAVLKEIAAWRDKSAAEKNIPRRWLLSDEVLIKLIQRLPPYPSAIKRFRGVENLTDEDKGQLFEAIKRGRACKPNDYPELLSHKRPKLSPEREEIIDLLWAALKFVCVKEGVASPLVASKGDVADYVAAAYDYTSPNHEKKSGGILSNGWRARLFGGVFDSIMAGEEGLTIRNGRIELFL